MSNKIMTKNYDMNIWDETSWESSGQETGGWRIDFYTIPQVGTHYGSGDMLDRYSFYLEESEVKQLTLGWGPDLGGDYSEDEDFFMDIESFMDTYKDIPQRRIDHFNSLPEYEQIVEPWEPLVKWAG